MRPIFKLSWQSIKYYRAQTLSILFSIIISVALTVGISSLIYSGELSNTENQRELYGDYHYLIYAEPDMIQSIEHNKVSEKYTLERIGKYTIKGGTEESANLVFANVDNEYLSMTGRDVLDGSYPVEANEIALDDFSMRNLGVSGTIGDEILIGNETYILSGIISDAPATYSDSMLCFVSDQFRGSVDKNFLYLKFDESKNLKSEVTAFMEEYGLTAEQLQSNEHLNGCLFSGNFSQLIEKVKWVINEPDANFTTFLMTLRYEFKLTSNVIAAILCLFSIFIIYSIFNISVMKRMPQYGVMRTLGINNTKTFFTLLAELVMLFVVGYPIGSVLGGAVAKSIYSRAGKLFVGDGAIFQQAHSDSNVSGKIVADNVMQKFSLDKGSMIFSLIFLLILLLFVCFLVIRKINKVTIIQMMGKGTPNKKRKNRKIYCRKRADLKKVLTQKFMFDRKGVFLGIVISLSIGGILFLGTSFIVKNTELNNELTLKSDDGLHSDCQIYMDTTKFNEGIPPNILDKMQNVKGVQELHGAKYFLGEIPVKKELLAWKEYFPEIGNDPAWTQPAEIMSRFNGVCVETDMLYKIKTNIYGYDDGLLEELEDYKVEGTISPEELKDKNTVILRTLVDSQNNADGLDIKPGDTITIKVPNQLDNDEEILKFNGDEELYTEKEFVVVALVNRVMSKNDEFIGSRGLDVIMTNQQMQENFGIDKYNMINIIKTPKTNNDMLNKVQSLVSGVPNCIVKDYSVEVKTQALYLKQKMVLFYGIAAIILIIGLFHIVNSMSYLVMSRKHEFGIMRAMGITDQQFYKMMIREGFLYGCFGTGIMLILYLIIQCLLIYMMQHVYLYVSSIQHLNALIILGIAALNIVISILAVVVPAHQIVKESIIQEVNS